MKRCLIVVDYQNDFVIGSFGFPEARELDGKIAQRIREYRKSGDDVVFTLDTHYANYPETREGKNLPARCIEGTDGYKLYGETGTLRKDSDRVFCKFTFGSDELFDYFREEDYDCIELAGVVTDICVIANAVLVKTAKPESEIAVNASCVASNDSALHKAALDVMKSLQIKIIEK